MATNNRRPDRVAEAIRVEVATFLSQDVKDPRIVGLVTVTGVDVSSESFRNRVSPLNTPTDPNLVAAVRDASTSSFHLAMLIGAALLVAGAIVNWFGIQNEAAKPEGAEVSTKEPVSSAPA